MTSVEKAFAILSKLSEAPYEYTLGELAAFAQCGKSGAHKLLSVMVRAKYVQQLKNKNYTLGCKVLELNHAYEKNFIAWNDCRSFLEELRDITGETVTLAKWENGYAHILYRAKSRQSLRVEGNIGRQLPFYASAHGKLLAAFQDKQTIDRLIASTPLEKLCINTITEPERLRQEYSWIRRRGYSVSYEESTLGSVGIAAPVYGINSTICASICCGTPTSRMDEEKKNLIISQVIEIADKFSKYLFTQKLSAN